MKVLVVDDETPARKRLIRLLNKLDDITIIGEASNGLEALLKIEELRPDLVFLDIEMPELNGIEVAQSLWKNPPAIVFATAYDKYALDAFDVAALDYIVKPIAKGRLADAVERARRRVDTRQTDIHSAIEALKNTQRPVKVAVRIGSNYVVLDPSAISAVLAGDHYAAIICGSQELLSEEPLDAIEDRLPSRAFFRTHRSAIINLDYLGKLERLGDRKYAAILNDEQGTAAPISRDRLPVLKNRLELV
ncbi:MAG: response regulator transcription factor [Deltaproteobacteria bacterium]|nr:response regulator transcription factor [Deltaproteobacteria bacterium]